MVKYSMPVMTVLLSRLTDHRRGSVIVDVPDVLLGVPSSGGSLALSAASPSLPGMHVMAEEAEVWAAELAVEVLVPSEVVLGSTSRSLLASTGVSTGSLAPVISSAGVSTGLLAVEEAEVWAAELAVEVLVPFFLFLKTQLYTIINCSPLNLGGDVRRLEGGIGQEGRVGRTAEKRPKRGTLHVK